MHFFSAPDMSNIINYTRLTSSDKQADRFVTCQVYEPLDIEQKQLGSVYSHVEILNPWFPNSQIGQTVINTLIREYYRGANTSELVNFENAVKKVNETLAQIAQSGETDWIGKTNSVLLLVNNKELHLAQTGTSQAYLYRGTKINHITEGLGTQEKPHPLKTFSNLISGTLQEGDKIIVANNAFYEIISASELKNIINSFPPALAAIESAKILRRAGATNANAIFFELTTKEQLANIPKEQKVDTVYLDQAGFNLLSSVTAMFASLLVPSAKKIFNRSSTLLAKGRDKFSPKIKESFKVTGAWTKKKVSSLTAKSVMTDEPVYERRQLPEDTSAYMPAMRSVKYLTKMRNRIRKLSVRFGFVPRINQKLILRIALVLICIIIITIAVALISRSGNKKNKDSLAKSAQVSASYDRAISEIPKSPQNALGLFESVIISAKDLEGTKYSQEAQAKSKLAQENIDKMTKTITVEAIRVDPLKDVVASIYSKDGLIALDANGNIFTKTLSSKEFVKSGLSKIKPPIEGLIDLPESSQIAIMTQDNKVEIFSMIPPNQSAIFPLKNSGSAKEYLGSIYILDNKNNQIYKYQQENDKLQEPSEYLKENTSVANSLDIAIDGSLYTLEKNSKVRRLSRGKVIEEIPIILPLAQTLKNPNKIFTQGDSDSIFIVDAGEKLKVIEISKSGQFKAQYNLSGSETQSYIAINANNRTCVTSSKDNIREYKF